MSRIEQLIAELCPDGVEWKELGEVCEVLRGKRLTKKELSENSTYPVFHGGIIPLGFYHEFNRKANTTMVINTGSVGEVGYSFVDFWSSDGTFTIQSPDNIDDRYIYFCLKIQEQYLKSQRREGGVPTINREVVENVEIPIPPLLIQQEIVRILDTFTDLDAELQAELESRKKQYEHYRDQLLKFDGKDVEWIMLGEVCLKTENIKWKENENIDYLYIDLTSVSRENNKITDSQTVNSSNAPSRAQQIVLKADVIFGTTRPTLKRVAIIPEIYHKQVCSTGFCVLRANQEQTLSKYLYYILKTSRFNSYVEINQEGASYPSISDNKLKQFKIPIPPLPEQERIVSILDKFEALVNVELPAEIAARRKQYEYYREKLLTFKRAE